MNLILHLIALSATVLGSAMAFPQARRLARHRTVEGVSAHWIGVSAALNGWWFAYGIAEEVWVLLPVSAISGIMYLVIGAFFLRTTGRRGLVGIAGGVALGMMPLPFLLAGGWALAGIAVGTSFGLQLLPAVLAACRSHLLAGVSGATWTIAWAESVLWLGYGVGIADLALISGGLVGAVMSGIILVRLAVTGHLTRTPLPARLRPATATATSTPRC